MRRAQGLTQQEFAEASGISQRMVTYYERQKGNPSATLLMRFAKVLGVSLDELLEVQPAKLETPQSVRLWRRLRRLQQLSAREQQAVLRLIDTMLDRSAKDE
jgi:transcriptional regulator with XRE-family HTH domain